MKHLATILFFLFIVVSAVLIATKSNGQVYTDNSRLLSYVNVQDSKRIYIAYIDIDTLSRVHYEVRCNDTILKQGILPVPYKFYNVPDTVWKESTIKAFNDLSTYLKLIILE